MSILQRILNKVTDQVSEDYFRSLHDREVLPRLQLQDCELLVLNLNQLYRLFLFRTV